MTLQQDPPSSNADKLETAREEIAWISETFSSGSQLEAVPDILEDDTIIRIPTPVDPLQDLVNAVSNYLYASFEIYPEPAADAEQALARMILKRGLSSGDVVSLFATALRNLDSLQEPPFNPALCLTRLLAVLVERQQKSTAFGAMRRAA